MDWQIRLVAVRAGRIAISSRGGGRLGCGGAQRGPGGMGPRRGGAPAADQVHVALLPRQRRRPGAKVPGLSSTVERGGRREILRRRRHGSDVRVVGGGRGAGDGRRRGSRPVPPPSELLVPFLSVFCKDLQFAKI